MTKFDTLNGKFDKTGDRQHCLEGGNPIRRFRGEGWHIPQATSLSRDAPRTRMLARGLSKRDPVRILVPKPIITIGRNRNGVCVAEMCWMSWKRSVVKQPKALNIAYVRKTVMQMQVNSGLCHVEFRMISGRLTRS